MYLLLRLLLCYRTVVCPVCLSVCNVVVLYSQTVGWIKMPVGMEVGLGPVDFVLDWNPASPLKEAKQPTPTFRPMSIPKSPQTTTDYTVSQKTSRLWLALTVTHMNGF